jgi:BNR/Asp-box repeat protein
MQRLRRRDRRALVALVAAAAFAAFFVAAARGDGDPQPVDMTHNVFNAPAPVAGAVFGSSNPTPGHAICTTPTQTTPNVNTDCESTTAGVSPHNETSIAVNPTDPSNIIGGANDYQLGLNSGGHVTESVQSRAHVSFDGGKTWSMFPVNSNSAYQATGDPAVAFDNAGRAYYATLGFRFVGPGNAQNPDVLVNVSSDKGVNWTTSRVAQGSGNEGSVGDLLDKEYVTAWGNGNALVTFGDFRLGQKGSFISARIFDVVTHDGGQTWSQPQVISGSLDEAFVSVPAVSADHSRVYVSFLNTTDLQTGRDDYEVVRVSPTTGAPLGAPVKVATVIDGATDYPIAFGRQTYQDSLFRSWAAGNVTVDPANNQHLVVAWSDMRNSVTPAPSNPYAAVTNSDIVVSESTDGGQTWSAPQALALPGDQWTPWAAFDSASHLRIGFFDRSYDSANHKYGFTLATRIGGSFSYTPVTTTLSDPTQNDRWFAATVNPAFPHATTFLGDYPGINIVPGTTHVVEFWTDMRNPATFAGVTRQGEDAYFAKIG